MSDIPAEPRRYEEQLADAAEMLTKIAHDQLHDIGEAICTFGVLVTKDPKTGAPLGPAGVGLVIMVCPVTGGDAGKDHITMMAKAMAIAGEAVSCVCVMEAWVSEPERGEKLVQPSESPNRMEAIVTMVERIDGAGYIERHVFRRDGGELTFDAPDRVELNRNEKRGRFTILPHAPPPPDVVALCRELVRNEPLDFKRL